MELYKSNVLQKGITKTLLNGKNILLNKTNNSIYQKLLRSDFYNIKNDTKLVLTPSLKNALIKREFTRGLSSGVIGGKSNELWKEIEQ